MSTYADKLTLVENLLKTVGKAAPGGEAQTSNNDRTLLLSIKRDLNQLKKEDENDLPNTYPAELYSEYVVEYEEELAAQAAIQGVKCEVLVSYQDGHLQKMENIAPLSKNHSAKATFFPLFLKEPEEGTQSIGGINYVVTKVHTLAISRKIARFCAIVKAEMGIDYKANDHEIGLLKHKNHRSKLFDDALIRSYIRAYKYPFDAPKSISHFLLKYEEAKQLPFFANRLEENELKKQFPYPPTVADYNAQKDAPSLNTYNDWLKKIGYKKKFNIQGTLIGFEKA